MFYRLKWPYALLKLEYYLTFTYFECKPTSCNLLALFRAMVGDSSLIYTFKFVKNTNYARA